MRRHLAGDSGEDTVSAGTLPVHQKRVNVSESPNGKFRNDDWKIGHGK